MCQLIIYYIIIYYTYLYFELFSLFCFSPQQGAVCTHLRTGAEVGSMRM